MVKDPLIIALDTGDLGAAYKLVTDLRPVPWPDDGVWGFKLNSLLLTNAGPGRLTDFKRPKVFADMKFHDIPETVHSSVSNIAHFKPDIITVHAQGGVEMMRAARDAAGKAKIFAVTVLSSQTEAEVVATRGATIVTTVLKDTRAALLAGVAGVICSSWEVSYIRQCPDFDNLLVATPGIREPEEPKGSQARTATAKEALDAGADYVIVGRSITKAADPVAAAQKILREIGNGA